MSSTLLRALLAGLLQWGGLLSGALALPTGMVAPVPATMPQLDFRDASLRAVFESLGRSSGINFVLDKDLPADARMSLRLRGATLDEALAVILRTQQLDYKALGERTLLIYPATPTKQREHQDLVTRTFYLNHVDAKTAFGVVRTMLKTRDLFIDERLNLLILRDTPETVTMAEQLLAGLDLPEPELMLDIELLEINRDLETELGLRWPQALRRGLPGGAPQVRLNQSSELVTSVLNPALTARLRGDSGATQLLSRPQLRARNREKVRLKVGEKLPVFSSIGNVGGAFATSVSYLDVGLNLEIEPQIQIDGEIVIKLNLEISSVIASVRSGGAAPATAYRTGTRTISSTLSLPDGQTQVLADLLTTEERQAGVGLPGLSALPLLGRLFGVRADTLARSEVVLLVTPRLLRKPLLPEVSRRTLLTGVDAQPGARSVRLRPQAAVSVGLAGGAEADENVGANADMAEAGGEEQQEAPVDGRALLRLSSAGVVTAGETLAVTVQNASRAVVRGQLGFNTGLFQPGSAGPSSSDHAGQLSFELPPRGQRVLMLRALPGGGGIAELSLQSLSARAPDGASLEVRVEGSGQVEIAEP